MKGFTDKPVSGRTEDIFGVSKYIKGLSGFILDCGTPMTLAVQGDWGSGKTSFMMLVKEELGERVLPIWFNTWQFSQFNLGDQLPVMLMSKLSASLGVKDMSEGLKKSLRTLGSAIVHLGLSTMDKFSGLDVSGAVDEASGGKENDRDLAEVISKLRAQFQDCVEAALTRQKKDRVVIFVDDLDRLQPARAVELLEVLKLFLDCDKCVFVLAIDYEVVSQGIRQKYGETIGADKGRSFFDKIIQVPFKMPIAHYDIKKYVETALKQMGLGVTDVTPYVDLIRASIGYNPRGMKRLLNAFLLLQRIHSDEDLGQEYDKRLLFAVLCLQLSYEEVYNFVVQNIDQLKPGFFQQLADLDSYTFLSEGEEPDEELDPELQLLFKSWELNDQTDPARIASFMTSFRDALTDDSGKLTDSCLDRLGNILNFSAVTASEVPLRIANGVSGKGVRYVNVLDPVPSWHPINDKLVVFDAIKKLPGWNGSTVRAMQLFGEERECKKYSTVMSEALGILYSKAPQAFSQVREHPEQYGLSVLFRGTKGEIKAPVTVKGPDIQIETKTASQQKVDDLCKLMKAMGLDPGELKLLVCLAHRG